MPLCAAMRAPILYCGESVDRAAPLRLEDGAIERALSDGRLRVVPVWRDLSAVAASDAPEARMLEGPAAQALLERAADCVLLGADECAVYVAADLTRLEQDEAERLAQAGFVDLRDAGPLLLAREAHLLALARGMTYWHRHHRHCGVCGAPTISQRAGHQRQCANDACGRKQFPRTDPAVIMLVTADDADPPVCLLGRQAAWAKGRFSTLAGFVEPGETLEQAVAREVAEETGVAVTDVRYLGSQPWPFPASLMLGFRARAVGRAISLNDNELDEARWFTRAELRAQEGRSLTLARSGSISRWLIEGWLAEGD